MLKYMKVEVSVCRCTCVGTLVAPTNILLDFSPCITFPEFRAPNNARITIEYENIDEQTICVQVCKQCKFAV